MLLTTLPVEDLTAAETVVRYYTYRWRIERYHDVRKRGCHIEDLPLETFDRLDRALAVYRIVAWRLLWLTYLARDQPEAPCTTVLRSAEGAAPTCRREPPPAPADLRTAVRWIAQLGGFLGRRIRGPNALARLSAPRRSHGHVGDLAPSRITRSWTTPAAASRNSASGSEARSIAVPAI